MKAMQSKSKLINLSTDSDKDDNGVINSNVNRLLYNYYWHPLASRLVRTIRIGWRTTK